MAPLPAKPRWGDEDDDDSSVDDSSVKEGVAGKSPSSGGLPPTNITTKNNIKTITSYRVHPSNPTSYVQTVTKVRLTTMKIRENIAVENRRHWKRFGEAAGSTDDSNVTIQTRDDVFVDDPNADVDIQDEDPAKNLAGNLNAFWKKQQQRQLERKYDVDGDSAKPAEVDGWTTVGGDVRAGAAAGKYVPPSARGGGGNSMGGKSLAAMAEREPSGGAGGRGPSSNVDRDQNTIRVTNISPDTKEADLQELFQPFGRISRVYLAKDKETLQSRGFAFVSFVHRDDAAKAMDKLQGYGYDHLILKLEWARPSAPRDPGTEGTQFRSGYGKALAQDTTQKVSYASNLTN